MCIAYILLFAFASISYISTLQIYVPVLEMLMVPVGFRSVLINACLLIIIIVLYLQSDKKNEINKNLIRVLAVWMPWVIYLLLRLEFDQYLAVQKLARVILHQLLTIVWFVVAYVHNPKLFIKYFLITCFILSFTILCIFSISHEVYMVSSGTTNRLSINKNMDPIWLARTFAFGALSFLLMKKPVQIVKAIVVLSFMTGIFFTQSRGPAVSIMVVLILYYAIFLKQKRNFLFARIVILSSLLIVVAIIFGKSALVFGDKFIGRGLKQGILSTSGRQELFKTGLSDFKLSPIIGVGFGNFGESNRIKSKIFADKIDKSKNAIYAHNIFLEILSELGLVGLLFFIIHLKPGKWMVRFGVNRVYNYFFILSFLFSQTSGDIAGNSGVFIFSYMAILSNRDLITKKNEKNFTYI